ncbi:alpha/beta fold hydrolase [Kutzneria albida]|uniref:AB hydrolase-1 domain-containing protein n=1 Tax=Kutzneria albida DSM 43870 TaxID=1449976 RepID=W5WDS5_9PSEU|nr:alpha/beta fold hydrolase [Kutzneria albida]AHH96339.1 hypothetical protein KALB_2971 [Kutzneria albida DSM 43870]
MIREDSLPGGLPCLTVGSGTPLVYVPGTAVEHRNPTGLARRIAISTLKPFADAGFAVHLVNRRPGVPEGYAMADAATDYATAIRERFGRPVHVLGHSSGGSLVLQLLADHPEVIDRAVVASAAYRLGPVAKRAQLGWAHRLRANRPGYHLLAPGITRNPVLRPLLTAAMWAVGSLTKPRDATDLIRMLLAEDAFDVHDRLPTVTTPTLVIAGARDYFWTPDMFAETARLLPRGRLVLYPRIGHSVNVKRQFYREVVRFLRAETP